MNSQIRRDDGVVTHPADRRHPERPTDELHPNLAVSRSRTKIPWSICHNAGISMSLVGPVGLEPTTKGFTVTRTDRPSCRKLKKRKQFSVGVFPVCRNRSHAEPDGGVTRNGLWVSRRNGMDS